MYHISYIMTFSVGGVTVEKAVKPATAVQDCVSTLVSSKPLDILDEGPKCFNNLVTGLRLISVSESSQCFCDLGFNFTTFLWVRSAISLVLLSADDFQPCQSRVHRLTNRRLYCVYQLKEARWYYYHSIKNGQHNKAESVRSSRKPQCQTTVFWEKPFNIKDQVNQEETDGESEEKPRVKKTGDWRQNVHYSQGVTPQQGLQW